MNALLAAYPRLERRTAWLTLGEWPTPVTEAPNFARRHGLAALQIKREDRSHAWCGGNKVRGLELLLAEALERRAKTLVTVSSVGSHHIARTAWHGRQVGLNTVAVVVPQPAAEYVRANLACGIAAGARYIPANYATAIPRTMAELARPMNWHAGRPPYYVPPGGTSPRACVGHVSAAFELKRQVVDGRLPEPDYLYVALGSLGTAAGLALGCRLAAMKTRVVGVVVSYRWYCTAGRWARLSRRTLRFLRRRDASIPRMAIRASDLAVVTTALGEGYAQPAPEAMTLAKELQECDGLTLDATYTSKTLQGAMQFIAREGLENKRHLFWHTYHSLPESDWKGGGLDRLPKMVRRHLWAAAGR